MATKIFQQRKFPKLRYIYAYVRVLGQLKHLLEVWDTSGTHQSCLLVTPCPSMPQYLHLYTIKLASDGGLNMLHTTTIKLVVATYVYLETSTEPSLHTLAHTHSHSYTHSQNITPTHLDSYTTTHPATCMHAPADMGMQTHLLVTVLATSCMVCMQNPIHHLRTACIKNPPVLI